MSQTCPYCQFQIPDGATVCGYCGAEKRIVTVDETSSDGNIYFGLFGALIGAGLAWFIMYKTIKAAAIGAVIGFLFGMWGGLITVVGRGLLFAAIGAAILGFIFSFFKWTWAGIIIGAIIGFFSGISNERERWFR